MEHCPPRARGAGDNEAGRPDAHPVATEHDMEAPEERVVDDNSGRDTQDDGGERMELGQARYQILDQVDDLEERQPE